MTAALDGKRRGADAASSRLFFALWPPEAVRRALHRQACACQAMSGGRLVPAGNVHVTLAFLGEIAAARIGPLIALGEALRGSAFELALDRVGFWPHNRIVYAGVVQTPPALTALAGDLGRALAQAAYRTDDRPYVAHVTLLRDARRAPGGEAIEPIRWRVDGYALVQSRRERGGSAYEVLRRFTLDPTPAMLGVHLQEGACDWNMRNGS